MLRIKIKTKNKKAFLLGEQTLKIIIAVICILAIGYLAFKLWYSYENSREIEQAKATLERIKEGADTAQKTGRFEMPLTSPKNWYLKTAEAPHVNVCKEKLNAGYCLCISPTLPGDTENWICKEFPMRVSIELLSMSLDTYFNSITIDRKYQHFPDLKIQGQQIAIEIKNNEIWLLSSQQY